MSYIPTPGPTGINPVIEAYIEEELTRISGELNRMQGALYPTYGGLGIDGPLAFTTQAGVWKIIPATLALPAVNITQNLIDASQILDRGGTFLLGGDLTADTNSAMTVSISAVINDVVTGPLVHVEYPVNQRYHSWAVSGMTKFPKGTKLQYAIKTDAAESFIWERTRMWLYRVPSYDIHEGASGYATGQISQPFSF